MATKGIQVELLLGGVMDDGDVALAGGQVFTYAAGTLTNKTTWTDRDKASPATNPIILDAAGKATIFADGVYKFVIKDADDVTIRIIDNLEFGQTFTGTFSLSKGVDVASASALTLGSDGNYFDVTGTTTITSIDAVGIGTVVKLHFDSALTLTHHATNLILPSEANITTAAGDEAEFIEYAEGDWICTNYSKASGYPVKVDPSPIEAGTKMAFFQAAAPTGWTKDTSQNDKALRVVSGSGGGSGGSDSISSPPTHIHSTSAHTHTLPIGPDGSDNVLAYDGAQTSGTFTSTKSVGTSGGGGTHERLLSDSGGGGSSGATTGFSPKYIDVIVCEKD